ncbi:MAG: hypothetical protein IT377_03325, partial [Polyangiaceae bacterium]|nr:hypothetical protein [Polyangiaceae bacterium]
SNLLDNDRHAVSLGLETELESWLSPGFDARVNLAIEHVLLVERSETKDYRRFESDAALEKNPGYPSYVYGGRLLAISLGTEAKF